MRPDLRLAIIGSGFGLGSTVVSTAISQAFPDWPAWVWQGFLGAGVLIMAISAVAFVVERWLLPAIIGAPSQPRPGWIQLHEAPFRLPNDARYSDLSEVRPPRFLETFLTLGVRAEPRPELLGLGKDDPGVPAARSLSGIDMSDYGVHWRRLHFYWRWTDFSRSPPGTIGFSIHPWQIRPDEPTAFISDLLSSEAWGRLAGKGLFVWALMKDGLTQAIETRRLQLWARPDSPRADFVRISPDAWRHYTVVDWPTGRAESNHGETLYSVHLEPTGTKLAGKPRA